MEIFLVGGAVRDTLLGLPVGERDWVVVGATPQEMLALGYTQVGKDFPVFLHPQSKEEYALARTERKTAPGYHGFEFHADPGVTLEEDLLRRDLTINAMAQAPDGRIIDPYGGRADLDAGRLRHVSPAFAEDPVRILRVARFAARFGKWGFSVAHGTNALMRRMVAEGEVDHLVAERVWAELLKALGCDTPERFFSVLHGCHALAVLFPEIEREYAGADGHGQTLPAPLQCLATGARASGDPLIRFAVLMFSLGADLEPQVRIDQAEQLCQRFRVPRDYARVARLAIALQPAVAQGGADAVLQSLERSGAFRARNRWLQLLEIYRLCGLISPDYARTLEQARDETAAIRAADLERQDLNGPELGRAIAEARRRHLAGMLAGAGADSEKERE